MTRRRVAEPREPGQPLALCKHVRGDARLPAREGLRQQVALELGDARPILHIAVEIGRIDSTVLGRQSGDRALQVADARQMLLHSGLVVWWQSLLQSRGVFTDRVQYAALAVDPAFFAPAEEPVEEFVGDHLRRQRALITRPTHVSLDAFAEGFLRDADLHRAETRLALELRRDGLIYGRTGRSASGERRATHQPAHGFVMSVARAGSCGGGVVQSTDDVNVAPEGGQRRKAGRHSIVRSGFGGNPISLRNAVAVEPQEEAGFDGPFALASGACVGRAARVEHRDERRQSDADTCAHQREALQKSAARQSSSFGIDVRHEQTFLLRRLISTASGSASLSPERTLATARGTDPKTLLIGPVK